MDVGCSWRRWRVMSEWMQRATRSLFRTLSSPVDGGCRPASSGRRDIVLLRHDDAPEFLRGNPFIVDGYRTTLPFSLCLKSLFNWNNDTMNIWTHLIGFLIFFAMMVHDNKLVVFRGDRWKNFVDQAVLTAGLLCYQFCLLASTGYHIFRCHSSKAHNHWLALDLTGILIGLLGCYLPGIHFAFYCFKIWHDAYFFVIGAMFIVVLYCQTGTRFLSPSWTRIRILLYILLAGCGVIPMIHWICLNGGFDSHVVQIFVPKVLIMYLLGLAAFAFYITQFPERWFPGRFDFVGSSHQVWHVIIVLLFLYWLRAGEDLFRYYVDHPCRT